MSATSESKTEVKIAELDQNDANKCHRVLVFDSDPESLVVPWIAQGPETVTILFSPKSPSDWHIPNVFSFRTLATLPDIIERQEQLMRLNKSKPDIPWHLVTLIIDTSMWISVEDDNPEQILKQHFLGTEEFQNLWQNARHLNFRVILTFQRAVVLAPMVRAQCEALLFRGPYLSRLFRLKSESKSMMMRFLSAYGLPEALNVNAEDTFRILVQFDVAGDLVWCLLKDNVVFWRPKINPDTRLPYPHVYRDLIRLYQADAQI